MSSMSLSTLVRSSLNREHIIFMIIGIASLTLIFGDSVYFPFWHDDFYSLYFVRSQSIADYARLGFTIPTEITPINLGFVFRPIPHYVFFYFLDSAFGANSTAFRLSVITLHLINGLLVFVYSKQITGKSSIGFIAGLLFLINRVFFSALYWISVINQVLLVLFALLSILTFILSTNESLRKSHQYYATSIMALILSLLSNESGVIIPVLIAVSVLMNLADSRTLWEKLVSVLRLWPHVLIVCIFVLIRLPFIQAVASGTDTVYYRISPFLNIVASIPWGIWWGIESFVEPWRSFSNSITQSFSLFQPVPIAALFTFLSISVAGFLTWKTRHIKAALPILLGYTWFLIAASPSLTMGILTDYHFSLPVVGFVLIVAYLVVLASERLSGKRRKLKYAIVGVFLGLSILSSTLVVRSLEQTTWPAVDMKLQAHTLEIAKQYGSSENVKTVCLISFPEDTWRVGIAEAAFSVTFGSEVDVIKAKNYDEAEDACPNDAMRIVFRDGEILVVPSSP